MDAVVLEKLIAVGFSVLQINWLGVLGVTFGFGLTVMRWVFVSPGHVAAPIVAALTTISMYNGFAVVLVSCNDGILKLFITCVESASLDGALNPIGTFVIFQTYFTLLVKDEKGTSVELDSEHISCAVEKGSLMEGAGFTLKENSFPKLAQELEVAVTE